MKFQPYVIDNMHLYASKLIMTISHIRLIYLNKPIITKSGKTPLATQPLCSKTIDFCNKYGGNIVTEHWDQKAFKDASIYILELGTNVLLFQILHIRILENKQGKQNCEAVEVDSLTYLGTEYISGVFWNFYQLFFMFNKTMTIIYKMNL